MRLQTIPSSDTHHIQECLLRGKGPRRVKILSPGAAEHFPGFMLSRSGVTTCHLSSPCVSGYLSSGAAPRYPQATAQRAAVHGAVHGREAPIQTAETLMNFQPYLLQKKSQFFIQ
ncbi:hypothetical protein EYF80_046661 [Liparis tanakae]|uniref:Uncharacterized protein n=1 Tax=Liparis tanakae TaxID=230148 RepID=A0A4Z2FPR4_9TELE|nr:hypothetical protein EYF80_046661 [Liparis tanakae]